MSHVCAARQVTMVQLLLLVSFWTVTLALFVLDYFRFPQLLFRYKIQPNVRQTKMLSTAAISAYLHYSSYCIGPLDARRAPEGLCCGVVQSTVHQFPAANAGVPHLSFAGCKLARPSAIALGMTLEVHLLFSLPCFAFHFLTQRSRLLHGRSLDATLLSWALLWSVRAPFFDFTSLLP
jgi:hypothetical protein